MSCRLTKVTKRPCRRRDRDRAAALTGIPEKHCVLCGSLRLCVRIPRRETQNPLAQWQYFHIPEPDFIAVVLDLDGGFELRSEAWEGFVFAFSDELR
jgi:hypothetical protein